MEMYCGRIGFSCIQACNLVWPALSIPLQILGVLLPCASLAIVTVGGWWVVKMPLLLRRVQNQSPKKENLTSNNPLFL